MCLNIKSLRYKIAKKDIVCYKMLSVDDKLGIYETPHTHTHIEPKIQQPFEIDDNREEEAIYKKGGFLFWKKYSVGKGFIHTYELASTAHVQAEFLNSVYKTSPYPWNERTINVYKCIIPKGTLYYKGIDDDGNYGYASKKIIFNP